MRVLRSFALLFALALSASSFAATMFTGDPFPLTNTRYRSQRGSSALLVSNGHDVLIFWRTATHFHYKRTDWPDPIPGRAVMESQPDARSTVVWTGSHFLFVLSRGTSTLETDDDMVVGRLIDSNGELSGEPFVMAAEAKSPQVSFDGTHVVFLWTRTTGEIVMQRLRSDGTAIAAPKALGVSGYVSVLASNTKSFAAVIGSGAMIDETWKLAMFDAGGGVVATSALGVDRGFVSIAANPDRYLLAIGEPALETRLVELDGSMGPSLPLETHEVYGPSMQWTGSKWVIASMPFYAIHQPFGFSVVHVNATNEVVEQRERHAHLYPSVAVAGDRVLVAWVRNSATVAFAQAPLENTEGRSASVVAAKQEVITTAAASHGTLVVWWESDALHAGVRMTDGRWSEHLLWPHRRGTVTAATDGQTFRVVLADREEHQYELTVFRLDREGAPIGEPEHSTSSELTPPQVFWTGRDYAIVSPTAVVWEALANITTNARPGPVIYNHGEDCALASSGNGFYAVWLFGGHFGSPSWPPTGVAGIRLGPDFQPLDLAPTVFSGLGGSNSPYYSGVDVVWDGTQYVVAWTGDQVSAAQIPADGGVPQPRVLATPNERDWPVAPKLTRAADGVALHWYESRWYPQPDHVRVALLARDGTTTPSFGFETPDDESLFDSALIATSSLPNGDIVIVRTARQNDVPIDGSVRLMMNVVSAVPLPERPHAPHVTAAGLASLVNLRWDAPLQRVNGYRVEYRVGDQPWIEIDRVLPPDQRSISVTQPVPGHTSFRVRAFNESGFGAYSTAVMPSTPTRRRAVR